MLKCIDKQAWFKELLTPLDFEEQSN